MNSITTRTAIITLEKENFVRMTMLDEVYLDLKDMQENHEAENRLTNNQPHVVLIDTRLNSMSSDEARRFSAGEEPAKYRIAVALLFKGLAGRIGANSMITVYQPKVMTEKFNEEAKAIEWLNNILERK
ncbi:MAG: hypothetical protein K0S53_928 [Bacteroidetes bacterium]|jgi:hypothetical protein|nr:hypothetical protein [Bacteroidota bacterium]MDF2452902.1 hypothetical protein [Bacteroidota bacterium]